MLERSVEECTWGWITFRMTERRWPVMPPTSIRIRCTRALSIQVVRRACAPLIDPHFAEALAELGAPGIAYGVGIDGELVHSGGFGVRDFESGAAPDADTAFRICSMTKSFVSMVVLSLRDEGRLDIDAPID